VIIERGRPSKRIVIIFVNWPPPLSSISLQWFVVLVIIPFLGPFVCFSLLYFNMGYCPRYNYIHIPRRPLNEWFAQRSYSQSFDQRIYKHLFGCRIFIVASHNLFKYSFNDFELYCLTLNMPLNFGDFIVLDANWSVKRRTKSSRHHITSSGRLLNQSNVVLPMCQQTFYNVLHQTPHQ